MAYYNKRFKRRVGYEKNESYGKIKIVNRHNGMVQYIRPSEANIYLRKYGKNWKRA